MLWLRIQRVLRIKFKAQITNKYEIRDSGVSGVRLCDRKQGGEQRGDMPKLRIQGSVLRVRYNPHI